MRITQFTASILGSRRVNLRHVAVAAAVGAFLFFAAQSVFATGDTETIHACVNNGSGTMRMVDAPADCRAQETGVSWNVVGPQGPQGVAGPEGPQGPKGNDGDFTGIFTSEDGIYSISVTNGGIVLKGHSGEVVIDNDGVTVTGKFVSLDAALTASLRGGANVEVSAGATTSVDGGIVRLNGGCLPLVRVTDPVVVDPISGHGILASGSNTVLSC